MNPMIAFTQREPLWLQAAVLAGVTLGGHFGFHLAADELTALNVAALLIATAVTRLHVTPNAKLPVRIGPQS